MSHDDDRDRGGEVVPVEIYNETHSVVCLACENFETQISLQPF